MFAILTGGVLALLGLAALIDETEWANQYCAKYFWSGQDE